MRGKVKPATQRDSIIRITPACAGKSPLPFLLQSRRQDHPRVCGEKVTGICNACGKPGSPPRVRGKGAWCRGVGPVLRITPACAGKSRARCAPNPERGGSPPRVRGKAFLAGAHIYHYRITPACAGKSLLEPIKGQLH